MPVKGNQKPKAEKPEPEKKSPAKPPTPKKAKQPAVYKSLAKDAGAAIPIDVVHEGQSVQAKLAKTGVYQHVLKLEAPSAFSVVKTIVFTEGPYEGQQAIIIRPAKAFPFLKIPKELRARIYGFYFAQKGVVGESIVLDGKRANKEIYAKTYADGSKNRVGLLGVNKELHNEAIPIFYAHTLKFESTSTLLDFLSQIPTSVRPLLHSLEIKTYIKTTSRNAMHFLSEARNLSRLRIEQGVFSEGDPNKAAKVFYADAYKFLEAIGAAKGIKDAGVDVLDFGKTAFTFKDDKKVAKPWAEGLVAEFKENLRGRLK
ncbi:hypothetical protein LTR36_003024 [Oleoguttula mirabilis]|uniref:Uncharacterized protein n=1 Tax=Oleoguttula mirabilis TaxID=1507867 RepID=A0AAV9JWC6_9PEZI|nr:hypothetical protein LTR36_003024 [Oleoguttula mirabilis]